MLRAARIGGSAVAAIIAADEVLIERFLNQEIAFTEIAVGLQCILDQWSQTIRPDEANVNLETLAKVDAWSRDQARQLAF